MQKVLVAYVPVLHQGYLEMFQKYSDADALFIFGPEIIRRFDWLYRKEIRALDPEVMCGVIRSLGIFSRVDVLDPQTIEEIRVRATKLVFANEEESRQVAEEFFVGSEILFEPIFLRWDRTRIEKGEVVSGYPVTRDRVHQIFMQEAQEVSQMSPDWWRQVGAVLVSGDHKVFAYNQHIPSNHTPYALGDPRNLLKRGVGIEITSVLHSEAAVVIKALQQKIPMEQARLYVTTFPCPYCANVLAQSGISELYFSSGYSVLDGADLLRSAGIKIFQVVGTPPL